MKFDLNVTQSDSIALALGELVRRGVTLEGLSPAGTNAEVLNTFFGLKDLMNE